MDKGVIALWMLERDDGYADCFDKVVMRNVTGKRGSGI